MAEGGQSRARIVALGILVSRLVGLVREKAIAWFFGVGPHADVYRLAFRAPNALQNLLGEQTLSASFIPVYSRLLAEGRREDAGRFAGAVFGLLLVAVSALVLLGMAFAPQLVAVLTPGLAADAAKVAAGEMTIDRMPLVIRAVRIVFPMTGLLVLSAWALGILNSHRRFLLPYAAPVVWNAAILTALFLAADSAGIRLPRSASLADLERWLMAAFWGALVGGFLQFSVQLPAVLRVTHGLKFGFSLETVGVREALRTLGPALAGRGVVQISLYVDQVLGSFLKAGAPGALGWAGLVGNLPLSVFGMSVAAAELPELSRAGGAERGEMAQRIERGLGQIAFVIAPAVVGYLGFGFLVAGLIFKGGQFTTEDNWLVYAVLLGYTFGLLASSFSRLLQNAFFALRDTKTPARIAAVRLVASALVGGGLMFVFDRYSVSEVLGLADGKNLHFGAVGLSLSAGLASWWEFWRLRAALRRSLPELRVPAARIARRFALAAAAALPAFALWWWLPTANVVWQALAVLPVYAAGYLAAAWFGRLPELDLWLGRLRR